MVSLSEVCHAIYGQRRDASARSVRLIFICPEFDEFNTWFNTADSFFLTPPGLLNIACEILNYLFLEHFCVDGPAALECNLNNICILCCILYKTLAPSPSFWAFNHWAPGGCGYLLFEESRKKKGREQRRMRMWGNLQFNTIYSTQ